VRQTAQLSVGDGLLDCREQLTLLAAHVLFELTTELLQSAAVRDLRGYLSGQAPDPPVVVQDVQNDRRIRPRVARERRQQDLLLLLEVLGAGAAPVVQERLAGGCGRSAVRLLQTPCNDQGMMVIARERHERGVASHDAPGARWLEPRGQRWAGAVGANSI
jgi:hypothetical protein